MTPGSLDDTISPASSLPSSPPSAAVSDAEYDSNQEAMRKEEEKLRKQSERDAEKTKEREQKQWQKKSEDTGYLKDLDWFLSRSQVKHSEFFNPRAISQRYRGSLRLSWTS